MKVTVILTMKRARNTVWLRSMAILRRSAVGQVSALDTDAPTFVVGDALTATIGEAFAKDFIADSLVSSLSDGAGTAADDLVITVSVSDTTGLTLSASCGSGFKRTDNPACIISGSGGSNAVGAGGEGTKTITVTVTDTAANSDSKTISLLVRPQPTVTFVSTDVAAGTATATVTWSAAVAGWDGASFSSSGLSCGTLAANGDSTIYTATCTATGARADVSAQVTATATEGASPSPATFTYA